MSSSGILHVTASAFSLLQVCEARAQSLSPVQAQELQQGSACRCPYNLKEPVYLRLLALCRLKGRIILDFISDPDIFDLQWEASVLRKGIQYQPLPDLYGPTMNVRLLPYTSDIHLSFGLICKM